MTEQPEESEAPPQPIEDGGLNLMFLDGLELTYEFKDIQGHGNDTTGYFITFAWGRIMFPLMALRCVTMKYNSAKYLEDLQVWQFHQQLNNPQPPQEG